MAGGGLTITRDDRGDLVVLTVHGELDRGGADKLLADAAGIPLGGELVLDLTALRRLDASGMRALTNLDVRSRVGPRAVSEDVRALLTGTRTWAVVGCSPDPRRDSHRIAALLQREGFRVIPVNPAGGAKILGERVYDSVAAIPDRAGVEVVDVFRRASVAGTHVDEAIELGARAVWMQLGVVDEQAAERGRAAGLRVIMDRCPAIELPRLGM
jgi:predicted CoA-binding protein